MDFTPFTFQVFILVRVEDYHKENLEKMGFKNPFALGSFWS